MKTNNCIEFKVKQNESTHFNIQTFIFQAKTKYSIDIFETIKPTNFICTFYSFTKIPKKYFGNSDTEPKRYIDSRDPARWKVIQKEMIENKIQEVTIKLCPIENKVNTLMNSKIKSKPKNTKVSVKTNIQNFSIDKKTKFENLINTCNLEQLKKDNRPKLIIIGCSNSKSIGGENVFFSQFNLNPNRLDSYDLYHNRRIDTPNEFNVLRSGGYVNVGYFNAAFNDNSCKRAIDRYDSGRSAFYSFYGLKNLYINKNNDNNLHILIVSGLYGLLKFNDIIHDYHLEMNNNPIWINENDFSIRNEVDNYIIANNIPEVNVFYSLSPIYISALKPRSIWKSLWINTPGHGARLNSAEFLANEFLTRI